jgi:glutathione S-transferase
VPEEPRSFVREMRPRWAREEADFYQTVRTIPFDGRETHHLDHQPFGQVAFLRDGDLETFERGAALLHLARKRETLMPRDPAGEAATIQWMFTALNSIEMAPVPWWLLEITAVKDNGLAGCAGRRFEQFEKVFSDCNSPVDEDGPRSASRR